MSVRGRRPHKELPKVKKEIVLPEEVAQSLVVVSQVRSKIELVKKPGAALLDNLEAASGAEEDERAEGVDLEQGLSDEEVDSYATVGELEAKLSDEDIFADLLSGDFGISDADDLELEQIDELESEPNTASDDAITHEDVFISGVPIEKRPLGGGDMQTVLHGAVAGVATDVPPSAQEKLASPKPKKDRSGLGTKISLWFLVTVLLVILGAGLGALVYFLGLV
jgi:hypothetical protein